MNLLPIIIKREFLAKVKNKSFIVMTFLSPFLFVGISVLIGYLANMNKDSVKKIAIYDTDNHIKNNFKSSKQTLYLDFSNLPIKTAKDSAKNSCQGMIFVPKVIDLQQLASQVQYISDDSPSLDFIMNIEKVIDDKLTQENWKKLGFDHKKIEAAKTNSEIQLSKFTGEETLKGLNEIKIAIGGVFGYLIMMFIIIYGNFVMRSVIEEKTNRIIEIIISSVKPFQLMMGKIIGTSFAGILQFLIWIILGIGLMALFSSIFNINLMQSQTISPEMTKNAVEQSGLENIQLYAQEIFQLPLATLFVSFIIYFIGGYFLYSSFYAAIGAAVDSETDSQQFLLPIVMPLVLGVYIGFFTVINDPHGSVATFFSIFPLTSPIVMLMRIPFGVPLWQLIVSMFLLYATFFLVVWFAAKIYRVGVLMYGKKATWKELYKWLKY